MMAAIFNHLWQSTLFAGLVAVLTLALRRNRARLRYGLWLAASVKFLVPFAMLAAVGGLLEWQQPPAPIRSIVASSGVRDFNAPFAALASDAAPMVVPAPEHGTWITPVFFFVWVCGCTAIALRRAKQWRAIRAVVGVSTPYKTNAIVPAGLRIRTAPTLREPGVVGLRKPVIILPEGIDRYLTERQLAAVLAHEVCHVHRRDNVTAAVHMAVEAMFWFHPLVWWIGARLVAEREQACDEHVVAETAEPIVYAEGIVNVCRRYVETPLMSVAGVGGADLKARIDAILANRIGLRLTLSKRLVLATVAALSLAVPVLAGAIEAAAFAAGQLGAPLIGPGIDPEARFEVVSIKRFDASGSAQPGVRMTPSRLDVVGMPLRLLAGMRLPLDRTFGWPDGLDTERYTISAKMPDGAPQAALLVAVGNLLKDRFKLVTHRETRELPVYNLVLARGDRRFGPAFKESSAQCQAAVRENFQAFRGGAPPRATPAAVAECVSVQPAMGSVSMKGTAIGTFVNLLPRYLDRQVIDRTGLTALYDLTLRWTPDQRGNPAFDLPGGASPGVPQPPADPDAPGIFTAVQEQLGLKLEAGRGPVEVVVIDRLEKPTLDE